MVRIVSFAGLSSTSYFLNCIKIFKCQPCYISAVGNEIWQFQSYFLTFGMTIWQYPQHNCYIKWDKA